MIPANRFMELDKRKHERKSFDCGSNELNIFIRQFAAKHRNAGISKTMVLPTIPDEPGMADIYAYYTLSHTQIERRTLPKTLAKKLPHYPIPVLLIAQLAVHKAVQNQGIGKITLIRALKHCLEINVHLPSYAVVVDALLNEAEGFYKQYGFQELDLHNRRTRLYLPMKAVTLLFEPILKGYSSFSG